MTAVAISGHRGLDDQTTGLVDAAIRAELDGHDDLVGVSCLADGADQTFAQAVLDAGGRLAAIVPAAKYREGLPPSAWPTYDALLAAASDVVRLGFVESDSEAHMAASVAMLDRADHLIAVWDGQPARGYGGTADVVADARRRRLLVTVIWPDGARRS